MVALMVETSTGQPWHEDPATAYVLSLAIAALLKRHGADENAHSSQAREILGLRVGLSERTTRNRWPWRKATPEAAQ